MNDSQLLDEVEGHVNAVMGTSDAHSHSICLKDIIVVLARRQGIVARAKEFLDKAAADAAMKQKSPGDVGKRFGLRGTTAAMAENPNYIPGVKDRGSQAIGSVSGLATKGADKVAAGPAPDPTGALVERIARAMCKASGRDPDELVTHDVPIEGGSPWGRFTYVPVGPGNGVVPLWYAYRDSAEVAIRTLTEEKPPYWTAHRMLKGWQALLQIRDAMVNDVRTLGQVRHHPDEILKMCDEGLQG